MIPNFLGGSHLLVNLYKCHDGGNLKVAFCGCSVGYPLDVCHDSLLANVHTFRKVKLRKLPVEIQDRRRMYLTLGLALIQSLAVSL